MAKDMICIVYISSVRLGLSSREITAIVHEARVNNQKLGITGMLLYNGKDFMQLIEGEKAIVQDLYEKVRKDHRHSDVTLLLKESITHKNFDNWSMGYKNVQGLKNINPDILNSFLTEELNFSIYKDNPYRALHFLEMFKKIIN